MQNHGILSRISHDNHVITFPTKKTAPFELLEGGEGEEIILREPECIGVNEATVHTCFCNYHDSTIFKSIESNPTGFDRNDKEQLFIFAYKAFAFEYYKTQVGHLAIQDLFRRMPQKLKKYPLLFVPNYRESQKKLKEMEYYKTIFDTGLISNEFDNVFTEVVEVPFKVEFSSVDCISPNFDIYGKRIRTMSKSLLRRIFLTIIPAVDKSYIIISCAKEDKKIFGKYFSQMKNAKKTDLYAYLSTLLSLYSENIVLNPKLWDKWEDKGKAAYIHMTNLLGYDLFELELKYAMRSKNSVKSGESIPEVSCKFFLKL